MQDVSLITERCIAPPLLPYQKGKLFVKKKVICHRFYASESAASGSFLNKEEVTQRVIDIVKKHEKVDPNKVSPTAHFTNDLGLDSLDSAEVVMEIENEFAVEIPGLFSSFSHVKMLTNEQMRKLLSCKPLPTASSILAKIRWLNKFFRKFVFETDSHFLLIIK